MEETPRKYIKPSYTKNDPREDLKLGGMMMWRVTYKRWESLIGGR
jgi:hypothetical protein